MSASPIGRTLECEQMNGFSPDLPRWCLGFATATALAFAGFSSAAAQSTPRPRVAVLPLENSSGDATQNFFADAMTDEIASALTGVRGLDVVARSSAFALKIPKNDSKAIGEALNASYLVGGAARVTADRVHFRVSVVRSGDAAELFSQEYDAARPGIFDLEETIAEKIAAILKVPLEGATPLVRNHTGDFDVYLDFLRAKVAARARGAKALADSAAILERVAARDPDFAPAAAMLAYDYALTPLFAPSLRGGMPAEERKIVERTIPQSDALGRHATALDPKGADGFVALGYANLVQRRMVAAEDAFRQALALNPNQADGLHGLSQLLAAMGRIKESLAMRAVLQADEQFIINYTADTAEIVWLDGDTDKAIAMLEPFSPGRTLELALVEASAGHYRKAAAAIRDIPATNYPPGMVEAAATILESAPAKAADPAALPRLGNLSFAYMHVDAPERVLEFYEDEISGGYFQPISTTWFWHPTYAAVRKTERFKKLARDLGLVEYWRARGWPAQCRPQGVNDFICE
jgi:TolB-like protein